MIIALVLTPLIDRKNMISKNTQLWYRSVLCAVVLACTACSQQDEAALAGPDPEPQESKPAVSSQIEPASDSKPQFDVGGLDKQISAAVTDLSGRTGVSADAITVTEARTVNWGSGAMGCPEKGKNYTQAIVPGVLLFLQAGSKVYRYHGSSAGIPFYCPDARARAPAMGPGQAIM